MHINPKESTYPVSNVETFIARVGKKGAIYLPKRLMELLAVRPGDKVLITVKEKKLELEFVSDPFSLAVKAKKWSSTTVEEFEAESEEEQRELYGS